LPLPPTKVTKINQKYQKKSKVPAGRVGFGDVQRERFRAPGSLLVTPGSLPVTGARVAHLVQYLADQSRELGLERVRTLTLPLSQDQS